MVIQFQSQDSPGLFGQRAGERAGARSHFHHKVAGREVCRIHDPGQRRRIGEEILPQPLAGTQTMGAQQGRHTLGHVCLDGAPVA